MHRRALASTLLSAVAAFAPMAFAGPARAVSPAWARPVPGAVLRPFAFDADPFAPGQHRGVDLGVARDEAVRAPCAGRVVVAGRIGSAGGVVTVACGPWRASVLPLGRIDVRRGQEVRGDDRVGVAGASPAHVGLHLGVRRATDPFGYVDPLRFLPRARPWAPPGPPTAPGGPRARPVPARPAPVPEPEPLTPEPAPAHPAPAPQPLPLAPAPARPATRPVRALDPRPVPIAATPSAPVAPWPAWAGAALLMAGAAGGVARARRRAPNPARVAARAPAGELGG